jgi:hypothetical protein
MSADLSRHRNVECLAGSGRPDRRALILMANQVTIAAVIDSVMSDERFLALIGEPATGKTILASALREDPTARSVRVLQLGKADSGEISLAQIVAGVLGKPLAELSTADVDLFINVMLQREQPGRRFVLIIDDAELLRPDAIGCLRLLASFATVVRTQVIFVGRPQFWEVLGCTKDLDGSGLIRRHWELARLFPRGNDATREPCLDRVPEEVATPALEQCTAPANEFEEPAAKVVASPRWPRRFAGVAAAAVMMLVVGSLALHKAPSRGFDAGAGSAASNGIALSMQPLLGQASPTLSSDRQVRAVSFVRPADSGYLTPMYSSEATARADITPGDVSRKAAQIAVTQDTVPQPPAEPAPTPAVAVVLSEVPDPSAGASPPPAGTSAQDTVPQPPAKPAPTPAVAVVLSEVPDPSAGASPPPAVAPIGEDMAAKTQGRPPMNSEMSPSLAGVAPANVTRFQSRSDVVASPDLALLLSRGDAMLELGDISAARRLYERAAALGSARAATAAGKTYDAAFLASIHTRGILPDSAAAAGWYRRAVTLGDHEAAERLAKLTPRN